ncbi:MAG: gamma-glutamylcyclotransferase family protein [Pseudomonadota bacterium]
MSHPKHERDGATIRLATYGTLVPGEVNAHQLQALSGQWLKGTVRGHLIEEGWGADHGCPAMTPDPNGPTIEVHVFESHDLPAHWSRLDAFEGDEYQRVSIQVTMDKGDVEASIYALRT